MTAVTRTYEVEDMAAALRAAGLKPEQHPSNIARSPYDYLFIFLSDQEFDGPQIIVSDLRELEDTEGVVVGYLRHYEDDHDDPATFRTVEGAVKHAAYLASVHS